jgi:hypothetical protein
LNAGLTLTAFKAILFGLFPAVSACSSMSDGRGIPAFTRRGRCAISPGDEIITELSVAVCAIDSSAFCAEDSARVCPATGGLGFSNFIFRLFGHGRLNKGTLKTFSESAAGLLSMLKDLTVQRLKLSTLPAFYFLQNLYSEHPNTGCPITRLGFRYEKVTNLE